MIIDYKKILQEIKRAIKSKDINDEKVIRFLVSNYNCTSEEQLALSLCKLKYNYVELDRIKGCMIGSASGDALGFTVEFLEDYSIFKLYGQNGITNYSLKNNIAYISDDTQMSLFTAEGLIRSSKYANPTDDEVIKTIYESYLGWLYTQDESGGQFPYKDTLLGNIKELYSRRAPGNTCISSLKSGKCGSLDYKINDSKGCGGIMRTAPIALWFAQLKAYKDFDDIALIGAKASAITHGHPLGYIPSAFFTVFIAYLVRGEYPYKAVTYAKNSIKKCFVNSEYANYCLELVDKACDLAIPEDEKERYDDDLDAIRELGEGWVAEETLAIALYCSLKYCDDEDGFEKALIASVNHSGDSDSTGALTGNIMGAIVGYDKIPVKFKNNLELHDTILNISNKMHLNKLDIEI